MNHEIDEPEQTHASGDVRPGNGNGNGKGKKPHRRELTPLWEGPVHFVLRSAEASLVLRPQDEVNVVDVVMHRENGNH